MRRVLPVFTFIFCLCVSGCVISGNITDGGSPLAGVTVKLEGASSSTATTDSSGAYKFNVFKKGDYTVTPVSGLNMFSPASQTVQLGSPFAKKTGIDFTAASVRKSALVLVNSGSTSFTDFGHYIEPYLKNFGVPYTVVDLASEDLTEDIVRFDIIIAGHRSLDTAGTYLSETEQSYITDAVKAGSGFVNFDDNISTKDESGTIIIECADEDHQDPVVTVKDELVSNDNLWGSFKYNRPFYTVFAHTSETVPTMRFYAGDVPDGTYNVLGTVYTSWGNCRYYYGFSASNPKEKSIYTQKGNGSQVYEHTEYDLGEVTITDGNFNIYIKEAAYDSQGYYWGWAKIRLVPKTSSSEPVAGRYGFIDDIFGFSYGSPSTASDVNFVDTSNYITSLHDPGSSISTGSMTVGGFSVTEGNDATVLAESGDGVPFLAVTSCGEGRAVQFGSGSWFTNDVKGPVYGLDDLVWRSIVWAARKPFAMQCLPNFVTMRVDDTSGPLAWADTAISRGIKPYIAVFLEDMDEEESQHLALLANAETATVNVHALNYSDKFYWDGDNALPWSNLAMSILFNESDAWHDDYGIPVGRSLVPHYYELGSTCLSGLLNRGIEYLLIQMEPNLAYGQPWLMAGPYRLYETGTSRDGRPVYYADYLDYSGYEGDFFVCVTEIRDDAGYEWYPDNDVDASIGRGTRQLKRAFDSRVLATLFTHEQYISAIDSSNWAGILDGVLENISGYSPQFVTYDEACDYIRSIHDSEITSADYDESSGVLVLTLTGATNVPTKVFMYTENEGGIIESQVNVPAFDGQATVNAAVE